MVLPSGAPPPGKISRKREAKFDKALSDEAFLARMDRMLKSAKYYDPSSPRTRKRRAVIRDDFEAACKKLHGVTDHEEIWVKDEITQRQMQYLTLYANVGVGILGDKIKAATLYEAKHALYWWNCHFVDGFSTMFKRWHIEMMRYIHQIATTESLSTLSRQKNFLSSNELLMLFETVMDTTTSVDGWKQHYAAWLLAWGTGARPGSIAVGEGYSARDTMPDGSLRGNDETLRWKDITWYKNEYGQVCFQLKLRYLKMHRDPHVDGHTSTEAERLFLYLPLKSGPLALDLTLILLGIAVNRGLFPGGLDYVLTTDDQLLRIMPAIADQAVFVSAETQDQTHKQPLRANRLTPKLQEGLVLAGLPSYSTMYSFRREAIRDTKNRHGTEKGKELAGHAPDSAAITFYDTIGLGDTDLQAFRTGAEGISREDAWKMINPVVRSKYVQQDESFRASLKRERDARVEAAVQGHPDVGKNAHDLKEHIDKTRTFLHGHYGNERDIPEGYGRTTVTTLKALLREVVSNDAENQHEYYVQFLSLARVRQATLQRVRHALRVTILEDIANEMKNLRKIGNKASNSGLRVGGHGGGSRQIEKEAAAGKVAIDQLTRDHLTAVESIRQVDAADARHALEGLGHDGADDDDYEEDGLDEDAYNKYTAAQNSRAAPLGWDDTTDIEAIVLEDELTESDPKCQHNSEAKRVAFLMKWTAKASIPNKNLRCFLCVQSPFATKKQKEKKWNLAQLERHYKTNVHDPMNMITSAAREVTKAGGKARCPTCDKTYKIASDLQRHLRHDHSMVLTGIEAAPKVSKKQQQKKKKDDTSESDEATASEDESSEEFDADASDAEAEASQAAPAYVGKGKGRA